MTKSEKNDHTRVAAWDESKFRIPVAAITQSADTDWNRSLWDRSVYVKKVLMVKVKVIDISTVNISQIATDTTNIDIVQQIESRICAFD